MRSIVLFALVLLGGCATNSARTELPIHGETPGRICNAAGTETFVGQTVSSETGAAILQATNSSALRWAPPGAMLTMDYSPSRVTVKLDSVNKVTSINCG